MRPHITATAEHDRTAHRSQRLRAAIHRQGPTWLGAGTVLQRTGSAHLSNGTANHRSGMAEVWNARAFHSNAQDRRSIGWHRCTTARRWHSKTVLRLGDARRRSAAALHRSAGARHVSTCQRDGMAMPYLAQVTHGPAHRAVGKALTCSGMARQGTAEHGRNASIRGMV